MIERAVRCHFVTFNKSSSLDPVHIRILSVLRLPTFLSYPFYRFLSSTSSAQSEVGSNFIQTIVLQSNKSVTSFIDCVLSLRTGKSVITKWVGGQKGMWVFCLFDGAQRWKAPELCKDALTKPQVCTQLTSAAVGSHFCFCGYRWITAVCCSVIQTFSKYQIRLCHFVF